MSLTARRERGRGDRLDRLGRVVDHAQFQDIRVTPNVYTTLSEVDLFADAMLKAAREGIG